jgi:hypothetical protein
MNSLRFLMSKVQGRFGADENVGQYFQARQLHQLPKIELTCPKCDVSFCFVQGCWLELSWTRSTVDHRPSLFCLAGQLLALVDSETNQHIPCSWQMQKGEGQNAGNWQWNSGGSGLNLATNIFSLFLSRIWRNFYRGVDGNQQGSFVFICFLNLVQRSPTNRRAFTLSVGLTLDNLSWLSWS